MANRVGKPEIAKPELTLREILGGFKSFVGLRKSPFNGRLRKALKKKKKVK
jgi:hypothetical protein